MNTGTTATAVQRGPFAILRERLAGRSDSEHIQALVRIAIAAVGLLYVLFIAARGQLTDSQEHAPYIVLFIFLASVAIFSLIVIWPQISHARRLMAMTFDYSVMSYVLYVMEDNGILFFPVYLWVTIGNGLRYGTQYLYTAMTMAIIGYAAVFASSPYWRAQWGFSVGMLIGLVALPLYFSILLKQLGKQHDELKKLYEHMARHATHDSLTNLPNRKHFYDQLAETMASASREGRNFTVLYLDLDGFKVINDDLGHAVGDQLIERTARRLEKCTRKGDLVARIGGDEFIVLLRDIEPSDAAVVAEKIIGSLAEPFVIAGRTLSATTSIGVATYPHDGGDVNTLIHNADSAMYEAKRNGKNGYRFSRRGHAPYAQVNTGSQAG